MKSGPEQAYMQFQGREILSPPSQLKTHQLTQNFVTINSTAFPDTLTNTVTDVILKIMLTIEALRHLACSNNFNEFETNANRSRRLRAILEEWETLSPASKGGRTPPASRQALRHETKDAVLLHS
jgi:hypothetical protein